MSGYQHTVRICAAVTLTALLAACAGPSSYVVLLPSSDGSVGRITVTGAAGSQELSQASSGAALDGSTAPFAVSPTKLQHDFGAAMAARPPLPEHFLLYFGEGSELTPASKVLLTTVLERAKARSSVDISVIGHTDTQGAAEVNEALARERANTIAAELRQLGLADAVLSVESHGERNLLVPTADAVTEPRNRRVEITLR